MLPRCGQTYPWSQGGDPGSLRSNNGQNDEWWRRGVAVRVSRGGREPKGGKGPWALKLV